MTDKPAVLTYTRATVRKDLETAHLGAKARGESLVHIIGGVALQAKLQGSRVYFYLDGLRVSRADAEDRLTQAIYAKRRELTEVRVLAAGITAVSTDTAVLTEGFHTGGYVGARGDVPVVITDRGLPPGTYNALLEARKAEPGKFDVIIVDDVSRCAERLERTGRAFDMIGRTLAVAIGMMSGKSPMRSYQREAAEAAMFKAQALKPKRNNGPRNRWGRLV